jgi:hypothetical protein
VNTITSRHGLAGLYGFMRTGTMPGTCVNVRDGALVIDSVKAPPLPYVPVDFWLVVLPT